MIEVIKCPCNKSFAACAEPYCHSDADWHRDKRKYLKKGCTVSTVGSHDFRFEMCTCKGMKPVSKDQTSLFLA